MSHALLFHDWCIYLYLKFMYSIGKDFVLYFVAKHAVLWPPVLFQLEDDTGITIWMCLSEEMTLRDLL